MPKFQAHHRHHLFDRLLIRMASDDLLLNVRGLKSGDKLKETDFVAVDDGVFSNEIDHFLSVGVSDTAGISGIGYYLRMHCTIKNGSIGTAS